MDTYTISHHPFLASGAKMRPLFDILRKEILAHDPCVSEEFIKIYVAYKAETNFVDLAPPQASQLKLTLNMEFHELQDPKGMARDMTNRGRWGNGKVEVALKTQDKIPYVMGDSL